jgi:hypothetical protein
LLPLHCLKAQIKTKKIVVGLVVAVEFCASHYQHSRIYEHQTLRLLFI